MARSAGQYLEAIVAALPQGAAFPRADAPVRDALLAGIAAELAAEDSLLDVLAAESWPGTASLLLAGWETDYGLPDCAGAAPVDLAARRAAVIAKMDAGGGPNPAAVVARLTAAGWPVTVEEFPVTTCESACEAALNDEPWRFVWRLRTAEAVTVRDYVCEGGCDEPLRVWGNETLECQARALNHAHLVLLFSYGEDFDNAAG